MLSQTGKREETFQKTVSLRLKMQWSLLQRTTETIKRKVLVDREDGEVLVPD